ncbi:hypothetical protein [Deinococcus sp. S9]|uniref:hypothetical protein n=1 Tax=Deinococcus sp. S9 TaxID=2545754 RepID=UPI00105522C1|nr:hypothetical protein [Deinococcus sp. S9]TDE84827.1 hypothetical protein E0686_15085 [Deinococcus sp. S9]
MSASPVSFPHALELRRAILCVDAHARVVKVLNVRLTNPHVPVPHAAAARRTPWVPQTLYYGLSRYEELRAWASAHHLRRPATEQDIHAARQRLGGTLSLEAGRLVLRGVTDPDRDLALRGLRSRRVLRRVQLFDLFDLAVLRVHCEAHGIEIRPGVPGDRAAYMADVAARRVEQAARQAGHHLPAVAATVISRLHGDLLERGLSPAHYTEGLELRVLQRDCTTTFASALERHHPGMRRAFLDPALKSTGPARRTLLPSGRATLFDSGD